MTSETFITTSSFTKIVQSIAEKNDARFAKKGESSSSGDNSEILAAIANLTSRIEDLEKGNAEVYGIEQISSGFRVGLWRSVDGEGNNLNGDAEETDKGGYIGIEQLASGNQFGIWQRVEEIESEDEETDSSASLAEILSRLEQLESYHAEVYGIEQLSSGFRVGLWQSVDGEGNKLNGDSEDYEEIEVFTPQVYGIEQLSSGKQFGEWVQVTA